MYLWFLTSCVKRNSDRLGLKKQYFPKFVFVIQLFSHFQLFVIWWISYCLSVKASFEFLWDHGCVIVFSALFIYHIYILHNSNNFLPVCMTNLNTDKFKTSIVKIKTLAFVSLFLIVFNFSKSQGFILYIICPKCLSFRFIISSSGEICFISSNIEILVLLAMQVILSKFFPSYSFQVFPPSFSDDPTFLSTW